jgi:uncharacterized membrane protein
MANVNHTRRAILSGLASSMVAIAGSMSAVLVLWAAGVMNTYYTVSHALLSLAIITGILINCCLTLAAFVDSKNESDDNVAIWV